MFIIIDTLVGLLLSIIITLIINLDSLLLSVLLCVGLFFAFKIIAILFIGFISLFYNKDKEYKKQSFFAHWTLLLVQKGIVSYSGAKIKTTGLEKLPKDHRYVLVFNHTSMFDPQVISTVLMKEPLVHISKPENFKIPIAGPFMHRDFTLSFRRNDLKYNAKVILKAASYLKEDRFSIGIAPEGTRNKENPSKLLPFNAGVFKLALRGERDIAVVELRNCEKIAKNFPFKKTNVEMNVIDVLKYDDIKDLDTIEISDKIQKILQDKIDKRK